MRIVMHLHTFTHAYVYTQKDYKPYRQFECSNYKNNCEKKLTVLLLSPTAVSVAFKMLD